MLHGNISRNGYGNAMIGRYGGCFEEALVANENDQVDVNFIARNNFNNNAYKNNFGGNN